MNLVYKYKQVISHGAMLEMELNELGRAGWELVSLIRIDRTIRGALGSEQGISPEPTGTYVYHFIREEVDREESTNSLINSLDRIRDSVDPGMQQLIDALIEGQKEKVEQDA